MSVGVELIKSHRLSVGDVVSIHFSVHSEKCRVSEKEGLVYTLDNGRQTFKAILDETDPYHRLHILSGAKEFERVYTLFAKTLTGKTIKLQAEPSDTVEQLKTMLMRKEGIPVDNMRLIFQGRQLVDGDTLESSNLSNDSVIHFVVKNRSPTNGRP